MKKFLVVLLAVVSLCWIAYIYIPDTNKVAFHLPFVGAPVSYLLLGGMVGGAIFWRWVAGK